ncbi:hypothetical protein [Rhodohalobacter sp.]|uniref:hypothetical protein n=1 Tax=Rhodohalobacter sp. TaxID=1974210 RepID=UPI002ACE1E84|nr:hypothetical protein [Rhodohalobacter sp.]MDZ7758398.1 hypothetical protein [Rhodohalobacter sp.]
METRADRLAKYGLEEVNVKQDAWNVTLDKLRPLLDDLNALVDVFKEAASTARILIDSADLPVATMTDKVTGSDVVMTGRSKNANI